MDTYNWTDIYPISAMNEDLKEITFNNVAAEINTLLGPKAWDNSKLQILGKSVSFKDGKYILLDPTGKEYFSHTDSTVLIKAAFLLDHAIGKAKTGGKTQKPLASKVEGVNNADVLENGEEIDKKGKKKTPSNTQGESTENPKEEASENTGEEASENDNEVKPTKKGKHKSPSTASAEESDTPKDEGTDDAKVVKPVKKPNYGVKKSEKGLAWEMEIPFHKVDGDKRLVGGVVYEPDTLDAQGDSASEEEIQKAAHNFMIDSKTVGIMHKEDAGPRAKIVESYTAPARMQVGNQFVKRGTWVMVVKILDNELWDLVKSDKITGFSMGGRAVDSPDDAGVVS